jgi:hypothetical protein
MSLVDLSLRSTIKTFSLTIKRGGRGGGGEEEEEEEVVVVSGLMMYSFDPSRQVE